MENYLLLIIYAEFEKKLFLVSCKYEIKIL